MDGKQILGEVATALLSGAIEVVDLTGPLGPDTPLIKLPPEIVSRAYDEEIGMMQDNGRFDPEAVKVIKSSLVDMHILESEPTEDQMFTTKFVQ